MQWQQEAEDEDFLLYSPALLARRASESWIEFPPVESIPVNTTTLQRKKSLPDIHQLPHSGGVMSREEVSILGTARREEVRRQLDEQERLRLNPLLYLTSPQARDFYSRQKLLMLVIVINVGLGLVFFKMLT